MYDKATKAKPKVEANVDGVVSPCFVFVMSSFCFLFRAEGCMHYVAFLTSCWCAFNGGL